MPLISAQINFGVQQRSLPSGYCVVRVDTMIEAINHVCAWQIVRESRHRVRLRWADCLVFDHLVPLRVTKNEWKH